MWNINDSYDFFFLCFEMERGGGQVHPVGKSRYVYYESGTINRRVLTKGQTGKQAFDW